MKSKFIFLLLVCVNTFLVPRSFEELKKHYAKINSTWRKPFCTGFRLLRKKCDQNGNQYPLMDIDFTCDGVLFNTLCEHNPCRNSNSDFEYAVGMLVIEKKITLSQLNSIRPIPMQHVTSKNEKQAPRFGTTSLGCW